MKEQLNDTLLTWEEQGTGPPVLLVHGIAECREAWRHQVPPFSERFRVIACDVRGFGESETGDADGRIEQYAADLSALLTWLGIDRAHIVGFSMGGVIAQRFAINYPEHTRGLVVAASSSVVNRRAAQYYLDRAQLAEAQGLGAIRATAVEEAAACFAVSPAEVVEAYREVRRAGVRDPRGHAKAARAMASLHERPLTEELKKVQSPALVITGERDVFCPPRASEIIHEKIARSTLRVVPAVGHCLHWEDVVGFNAAVIEFLSSA